MTDDVYNGAKLLMQDIDSELENKRLSRRDRLVLRSQRYQLEYIIAARQRDVLFTAQIAALQKHDMIAWGMSNPRAALLVLLGAGVVNGMVNWAGIRKPLIQAVARHIFGVDLDMDLIP